MSYLRYFYRTSVVGLFKSKKKAWSQVARDIGGELIDNGYWRGIILECKHADWDIQLDVEINKSGAGGETNYWKETRIQTVVANQGEFSFAIWRDHKSFFGDAFGTCASGRKYENELEDIEIGDLSFDENFVVRSNNPEKIRLFLDKRELRQLINQQSDMLLDLTRSVDKKYRLYFNCSGVVKDTERLKAMFGLFTTALDQLFQIDSDRGDGPDAQASA
jgi:hypothetical protein